MNKALNNSIALSQAAYDAYKNDKKFYQALRIYNANKRVYKHLENALDDTDSETVLKVIQNYLFHLDDWMHQFEFEKELLKPSLNQTFVFQRLEGMIAYSEEFRKIQL